MFRAPRVREEEELSKPRQRKRDMEVVDKVEVAPGIIIECLLHFRAALIGPI